MSTDSRRAARKDDHVRLAEQQHEQPGPRTDFEDVEFIHHALGGVSADEVDLTVRVGNWTWPTPFYVNGMTGGTEKTTTINRELAITARETGMPMACGSVSVALDDPSTARGFTVIREENPDGFVMANLGAGRSGQDAVRAVELLHADALQLHVNAVQETAMPEGSRDFSDWARSVATVVEASPVPVIVKEVGFGLSRRTLSTLSSLGVQIADVSGKGGTDFLSIESSRRTDTAVIDYSVLTGFGQSALACLLDAPEDAPQLLASGGVRNPYDVVKALACGASAVGVAGVFLKRVLDGGAEALVPLVRGWVEQTTAVLALLGASSPAQLRHTDLVVRGGLGEFCQVRGIDRTALSRRRQDLP